MTINNVPNVPNQTPDPRPKIDLGWLAVALVITIIAIVACLAIDSFLGFGRAWMAATAPNATVEATAEPTTRPRATAEVTLEEAAEQIRQTRVTAVPTVAPTATAAAPVEAIPAPGALAEMPSTTMELAPQGVWFHRVYNPRLFHAPEWAGADSWFVSLAIGENDGGHWISHGNPGQVVFRGTDTHITWQLGVHTTAQHKNQFMGDSAHPAAINVRITPNSPVTVFTADGQSITQNTSDAGDITIILPDEGTIEIRVDYTTGAPTHESLVWWGPYDRSKSINTIDAR